MGSAITKQRPDITFPVAETTIKLLESNSIKQKFPVLITHVENKSENKIYKVPKISTWLCGSIMKNSSKDVMCSTKDIDSLKKYLADDLNLYTCDISKQRFGRKNVSTKSEFAKFQRQQEQEVVQILDKEKHPNKILSYSANKQLKSNLKELNSKLVFSPFLNFLLFFKFYGCERPLLLGEVILPKLEEAYVINQKRSRYDRRLTHKILEKYSDIKYKFDDIFIRQQVTAPILRRTPSVNQHNGVVCGPGMDRAHKLSLHLAVNLWKKVYGHDLAYANVVRQLRRALSLSSNIYVTCHHTNRVLHVKYDNEIISALKNLSTEKNTLSPGAKLRIKQIIGVLPKLQQQSPVMNDFVNRSISALKTIA